MTARLRKFGFVAALTAALLLLLAYFGLQWWLTSSIGRGVVESRLSAALGRPARLDGNFSTKLLPLPGASGSGLKIFTPDGRWLVLEAGKYLAQLSLWPLLKGQVEVVALQVADASVDLSRLASSPGSVDSQGPVAISIPAIHSFELENATLYFNGMGSEPSVQVTAMSMKELELDEPAELKAEAVLHAGQEELARIGVTGALRLHSDGRVSLTVRGMDIRVPGFVLNGINGEIKADLAATRLEAVLDWNERDPGAGLETAVNWEPVYSGQTQGYALDHVGIRFGQQVIAGSGCLLDQATLQLHLDLQAESLAIDDISALVDAWRLPSPAQPVDAGGSMALAESENNSLGDLPFDLAVRLRAGQARYGETLAEGISLRAGPLPDCPDRL